MKGGLDSALERSIRKRTPTESKSCFFFFLNPFAPLEPHHKPSHSLAICRENFFSDQGKFICSMLSGGSTSVRMHWRPFPLRKEHTLLRTHLILRVASMLRNLSKLHFVIFTSFLHLFSQLHRNLHQAAQEPIKLVCSSYSARSSPLPS